MGDTYCNYSQDRLDRAFEQVKSSFDWKAPIDVWVRKRDQEIIAAAVMYFTTTPIDIVEETDMYVRIKADGYRAGPAGDH